MNNMGPRGSADLSQNMDSLVPFGYVLSGGQSMMDPAATNWQAKHVIDTKMLDHNQQAIKINSGHSHTRHLHTQAQIGADDFVDFNSGDLSAEWFMPFNMDPRADFQDVLIPKEGEAANNGAIDSFSSLFGTNGMGTHPPMDGLRHTL